MTDYEGACTVRFHEVGDVVEMCSRTLMLLSVVTCALVCQFRYSCSSSHSYIRLLLSSSPLILTIAAQRVLLACHRDFLSLHA